MSLERENRAAMNLLSSEEIVLMLQHDPTWTLPPWADHRRRRMLAARQMMAVIVDDWDGDCLAEAIEELGPRRRCAA